MTAQLVREMRTLAGSRWISQAIYAAAELGIPDALDAGPRAASAVVHTIGADARATGRLLRALATVGIVADAGDGEFALTPLGATLRARAEDSMRGSVLLTLGPSAWRAWGALVDCVRTGDIASNVLDGVEDAFAPFATAEAEHVLNNAAEGTSHPATPTSARACCTTGTTIAPPRSWRTAGAECDTRLLVIETVVPDEIGTAIEDQWIAAADRNMLLATGGRERTKTEYRALLHGAGWDVARIVPTASWLDVIEARGG